jgi:hypothetical protein
MDVTENNIIQASTSHSQKRCLQAKKMRIADLEEIFRRIVLKLKFELGDQAEIRTTTDLYRLIPTDKWSKFEKSEDWNSASKIHLGSLNDDIEELEKLVNDRNRVCTYVDFDRVAALLREISDIINPVDK